MEASAAHDLRLLKLVWSGLGQIFAEIGDLKAALTREQQALDYTLRSGELIARINSQFKLAGYYLDSGCLIQAQDCARSALSTLESTKHENVHARVLDLLGKVDLCRGRNYQAASSFEKADKLVEGINQPKIAGKYLVSLARAYLAQGKRLQARTLFQTVTSSKKMTRKLLAWNAWSGFEEAVCDTRSFEKLCRKMKEDSAGATDISDDSGEYAVPTVPFLLEPSGLCKAMSPAIASDFASGLSDEWAWQDLFGDCSYAMCDGVEIRAANGRDLYHVNLSAPRLMRSTVGSFAFQTMCRKATDEMPCMGGILLWKNERNYLILQRGRFGRHQIFFGGCLDSRDMCIGQGRLPADHVFLRLERAGGSVRALCSADGTNWLTAGSAGFAVDDPVSIGLHATGCIDRTIHHGAFTEGTAIRFEKVEMANLA